MRSGRQSDRRHRSGPENASPPLADVRRGGGWKPGKVPRFGVVLHGGADARQGELALATDDVDWALVGEEEDTGSVRVRRILDQSARASGRRSLAPEQRPLRRR